MIDTSAVIAILQEEPEFKAFKRVISESASRCMAAPTKFELMMVTSRRPGGSDDARAILNGIGCTIVDWTDALTEIATEAFLTYGKGRGHPAQLNFGDCMSYALAKSINAPLLFKGGDFAQTDITSAIASTP